MGNPRQRSAPDAHTNRLYQRSGSPYWQAEWYDVEGQRHQRSTRTTDRIAAIALLRAWERAATDPARAAAHETTLKSALEALQELRAQEAAAGRKSLATVTFVTKKAGHPLRLFGETAKLSAVTAKSVDAYIARRRTEGASDSTIHKELVVLRGACALAARRGRWAGDVAKVFPRGFSPSYVPKTRWLPPAELERLLEELSPASRPANWDRAAVVAFIVATGAEWSAVCRARVEDIDLDGGYVRVRGSKNALRDRKVPIAFTWQVRLLTFAVERARGTRDGLLFRPWINVRRALHRACELAKIPPCSPHDLRRTFGHWIRGEGAQPATVGAALGHRDGRMAERVYAALEPWELAAALARESGAPRTVTKVSGTDRSSAQRAHSAHSETPSVSAENAVPRDGIEPPTRGFSIIASNVRLRLPGNGLRVVRGASVTKVSGGSPRRRSAVG